MADLSMMDPERWRQIDALLQAALERQPAERASFLDEACSGDESLRSEVESLLVYSGEQALSLFNRPAFEMAAGLFDQGQPDLRTGENISHYEILSLLGEGGMGEVYLAQDRRLGRKIAIKLLPGDDSLDETRLRRFQQEARAASALNHPNIITIHEIGEFEGRHFIATEFIEGRTLRQLLKRRRLDMGRVLEVAIQAAGALAAAHEVGIVHRDIKPENIMLRPDGLVKILDFGLAQLSGPLSSETDTGTITLDKAITTPGLLIGTVNYMSPEQARGLKLDGRTDIFSLGVVIYEMITGRPPFEGETTSDLIAAILKVEPPPLDEYMPDGPAELQRIISKALRKDREERYQTIKDLLVDLKAIKREMERPTTTSGASAVTANGAAFNTGDRMVEATGSVGIRTAFNRQYLTAEFKRHRVAAAVITSVLLIGAAAIAFIPLGPANNQKPASHFQNIRLTRITTSGAAHSPALSPDGQDVAFLSNDNGQQNLWIQQVATGSKVQISSLPRGLEYDGLTFSPDGAYLYYVGDGDETPARPTLYRIPKLGGPAHKLISGIDSSISLSFDGNRVAFVRSYPGETAVIVANVDGSAEQKIASRHDPDFFWSVAWSPDGTKLACSDMRRDSNGLDARVIQIEIGSGEEKPIIAHALSWIGGVRWLRDGSGLVINAQDKKESAIQLWFISYPDGEARRITTDLNNYSILSVAADSNTIMATQTTRAMNLWIVPDRDAGRAERITSGYGRRDGMYGVCWTPDGKIVYSSFASGSQEIWMVEPDGRNPRQLTMDSGQTHSLSVSPDGRLIAYVADRNGGRGVWRINIDGSNPKQLTRGTGGGAPYFSTDSKWVYYHTVESDKRITWKVSVDGGEPVRLNHLPPETLEISADGKLAIYIHSQDEAKKRIGIIPAGGGQPVKLLDLPASAWRIRWMPGGQSLTYIDQATKNIWIFPIDRGQPREVTAFKRGSIFFYAWSPDSKRVAVALDDIISDVVLINDVSGRES